MAIGPDEWGVHGWKFIHHIALGYPNEPTDNDKNNYKSFFLLIGDVLPCYICSNHYKQNLLTHPLTDNVLSNKINLINWTIDMHNEVNKINGKKIYSYNEAINLIKNNYINSINYESYENISASKDKKSNSIIIVVSLLVFIIIFFCIKKIKSLNK
jgi:hypothetical protein